MFLLLSFYLLSLRVNIDFATHSLTSFIDNDPFIESFISRIQSPSSVTSPTTAITTSNRHRRGPFLQLTRVGTLEDDFFSGDDELDHRFFGNLPNPQLNSTSFILDSVDPQLGFSNFVSDNGIRTSDAVRSSAKLTSTSIEIIEKDENVVIDEFNRSAPIDETPENKSNLEFFLKRFDLEYHDFTALLYHVGAFSASYASVVLGFVLTHAFIQGIIFVLVVNNFCRRYNSFVIVYLNGIFWGLQRLTSFILMRWVIRDTFTQLLALFFFGKIDDRYSLLKIFVRAKFMPFSMTTPWGKGFEKEIQGYIISWLLLDVFISFVFAVGDWIVMADPRKNRKAAVKEGWHLLSLMLHPAINLKCYEAIVCGPFARGLLARTFGDLIAMAFQSFMEVYFMVAWMMYYLSVKSVDANSHGQPFGQRELEAMLEDVR